MPIQRDKFPVRDLDNDVVLLQCRVTIGAAGAVSSVEGKGFTTTTVTKAADGRYQFVLPGQGTLNVIGVFPSVQAAVSVNLVPQVVSVTEATRTVIVRTVAVATETNPSSGDVLSVLFLVKNSNLRS